MTGILCLAISVLYPLLVLAGRASLNSRGRFFGAVLAEPSGRVLAVYPSLLLAWVGVGIAVALAAVSFVFVRSCAGNAALPSAATNWWKMLLPLTLLPLSVCAFFLPHLVPPIAAWNIAFFVILVTVSTVLSKLAVPGRSGAGFMPSGRLFLAVLAASSVLYTLTGWHFTRTIGPHSGDEGHYLIQAASLRQDGDLDIKNELAKEAGAAAVEQGDEASARAWFHVSLNCRDGHWYSLHPFGLSLLLAPVADRPPLAVHCVLGLIAGFGMAGILLWCRVFGAGARASALAMILFGLSSFWLVYSSRALPEVLGATLSIYLAVSVFSSRRRPWLGMLGVSLFCVAMPWAHARFAPVAAIGAAAYSLSLVLSGHPLRRKVLLFSVFAALSAIGGCLYLYVMTSMFKGGSGQPGGLLFSVPVAIWHNLGSRWGVLYSLPVFAWMLAAAVWSLRDRDTRYPSLYVLTVFVAVLMTSCSTVFLTGGAGVAGRFLVVVAPLFVAPAARMYERTGPAARWLMVFLGLVSAAECVLMLPNLRAQAMNFGAIKSSLGLALFDITGSLLDPLVDHYSSGNAWHPFAIALYVTCLAIMASSLHRINWAILALPAAVAVAIHLRQHPDRPSFDPGQNANILASMHLDKASARPRAGGPARGILDVSDRFSGVPVSSVSGRDLGSNVVGAVISQPRVEANDWNGRGYQWCTLVEPFRAGRGWRALRLRGLVKGENPVVLAVREGSVTLHEGDLPRRADGSVDFSAALKCRDRGDVYILMRVNGTNDTYTGQSLAWSPFSDSLLKDGNFNLPDGVVVPGGM